MSGFLRVKNWERLQHYKDRSPPWIKLYNDLLEDYEFAALPDAAKAHAVLLWLLASRLDNKIPADAGWIASKIGATEDVDVDLLRASGFLDDYEPDLAAGKRADWPSRYIPGDVRAFVLGRDRNRCRFCKSTARLEIDHILPVSAGGTADPGNLQVLCRSCNRSKRNKLSQSDMPAEQLATQAEGLRSDLRSLEGEGETEVERESEKRQKRKPSRSLTRTFADDPALWMHVIWTEELGSQQPLAMTKLRQGKYRALFVEQLQGSPDPRLAFRAILHAVKLSTHHMSERAYQMPESLFKDESRRDTWVQKTLAAIASADRQTKGASDFEEYMKERRNGHTNGNGGYGA